MENTPIGIATKDDAPFTFEEARINQSYRPVHTKVAKKFLAFKVPGSFIGTIDFYGPKGDVHKLDMDRVAFLGCDGDYGLYCTRTRARDIVVSVEMDFQSKKVKSRRSTKK